MDMLPAVLLFAFSSSITPGPNNILIMSSGLNYGLRRSVPHLLGICFGFPVMVLLIGLGLGVIFERYPVIHEVIRAAGISYLLYLAWRVATTAPRSLDSGDSKPLNFLQAVLFQWVNPKAWIMGTGAIAAFTTPEAFQLQLLVISAGFCLMCFPCTGSWLFFGSRLQGLLQAPSHQRLFNLSMALLLVASIVPVLLEMLRSGTYTG